MPTDQSINVEVIIEVENHYMTITIVIINWATKYQWMLKLVDESLMRNIIFT